VRAFETAPADVQEILNKPICDLGLRLDGSPLERFVQQLYGECERKGLKQFRPPCYLTDEWGCPSGEPVVGIPFYLANPQLSKLEREMNDLEDAREIMMYLRHEAGHAFNYAYRLHKTPEWRQLFGSFRRAYRDNYRPVPFSRSYVRHMAGWYAQKHPDEDFAETFAVWLTPGSRWRTRYRGWQAMAKLKYMNRIARKLGDTPPLRAKGDTDITVAEMRGTVGDFYQQMVADENSFSDLALDSDLIDIFIVSKRKRKGVRSAAEFLREHRKLLTDKVTYWSGVQRPIIKKLVESVQARVEQLTLRVEVAREAEYLTDITVYVTALAMNYLARGKFAQP
jgi:Putative zinc-binding metallo-peptidase